jgi:hypothetical protein
MRMSPVLNPRDRRASLGGSCVPLLRAESEAGPVPHVAHGGAPAMKHNRIFAIGAADAALRARIRNVA